MKKSINIIFLLFWATQFTSCVNKNAISSLEEETARRIFSRYTDNKGDNIYGIGKASPNRGSLQKDVAMAYAQSEIQKQIYSHIKSTINIENKNKNEKNNIEAKSNNSQQTIGELRGAKIIDTYRGASGTLYILMKYNFKEYIDSISSISIRPNFLSEKNRKKIKQ